MVLAQIHNEHKAKDLPVHGISVRESGMLEAKPQSSNEKQRNNTVSLLAKKKRRAATNHRTTVSSLSRADVSLRHTYVRTN